MKILDFIFPKFCVNCRKLGDYVCEGCFTYLSFDISNICAVCSRPAIFGETHPGCRGRYTIDGTFVGIEYNPIAKKLLYQFKYKPYLSDLADFLTDLLYESLIQKEEFVKVLSKDLPAGRQGFIIVPIPLFHTREKIRGYNQSELLAKKLSKKFDIRFGDLLIRTKDTKTQVGQTKKQRRENLANAFSIRAQSSKLKAQSVFLVDDILTTGATMSSAANTLKRAGAKKVFGIALAKER